MVSRVQGVKLMLNAGLEAFMLMPNSILVLQNIVAWQILSVESFDLRTAW